MQSGLTSSCLQQREAPGYPYMFHDPLHSLSSSYNARSCNPAVAHAQPTTHHPTYGSNAPSSVPVSTGTGKLIYYIYNFHIPTEYTLIYFMMGVSEIFSFHEKEGSW